MATRYYSISEKLKNEYGRKIYKLSLSSGCTCPNRDGKLSNKGCSFCSEGGSGDFAAPFLSVSEQIELAKEKVAGKMGKDAGKNVPHCDGKALQGGEDSRDTGDGRKERNLSYIAYFQSFTNTYGDTKRLKKLYSEAINHPDVAILSLGTRPDCLEEDKLDMLSELRKIKPVWVELGLQTVHQKTAEKINRCYALPVFEKAYAELKKRGIEVIIHVILGLPGEGREDMLETVRYISNLKPAPDGVKLQLLHVMRGTGLAEEYEKEPFHILTLPEYAGLITDCLTILPEETAVHRITGDAPKKLLIEPLWSADKKRVLNYLNSKIREWEKSRT